jgi:single-strand DNA-binding protein
MASLNKVLLIGNLTRDPDVRMMSNGRPVCNFGLALNRNYKDSEGNRKEEVTFVDVECFGPRAEAVAKFFTKGRSIFVEGRLKLDQWESKEGEKRSAIRVVLDNFEFVDSKQDVPSNQGRNIETTSSTPPSSSDSPRSESTPSSDSDLDDDVPF